MPREPTDDEIAGWTKIVDQLSGDAAFIASQEYFTFWISGGDFNYRSALMVPRNSEQEAIFVELLNHGLVWLDSENGYVGYRSTELGVEVGGYIRFMVSSLPLAPLGPAAV